MAILHSLWSVQFFTFLFALLTVLQLQSISHFQDSQLTALFTKDTNLTPRAMSRNTKQEKTPHLHMLVEDLPKLTAAPVT